MSAEKRKTSFNRLGSRTVFAPAQKVSNKMENKAIIFICAALKHRQFPHKNWLGNILDGLYVKSSCICCVKRSRSADFCLFAALLLKIQHLRTKDPSPVQSLFFHALLILQWKHKVCCDVYVLAVVGFSANKIWPQNGCHMSVGYDAMQDKIDSFSTKLKLKRWSLVNSHWTTLKGWLTSLRTGHWSYFLKVMWLCWQMELCQVAYLRLLLLP